MKQSFMGMSLVAAALCAGCSSAPKKCTVPLAYEVVTNKVAKMKPAIRSDGGPRSVRSQEKGTGSNFIFSLREPGGDVKFGPYTHVTHVTVSKLDSTNTCVELETTKYGLIRGRHHLFFTERRRWKELQEILKS